MPEFIASKTPPALPDEFARGYFEVMEWTDCTSDNPELESAEGFGPDFIATATADCAAFCESYAADLSEAETLGEDMHRAGVDFWLTRNHHGAGFWDRGLGEVGKRLTDAAHSYGGVDLYRGDDGLIYGG